jgi:DNA polymerase/3'-5' exonuclease PolX
MEKTRLLKCLEDIAESYSMTTEELLRVVQNPECKEFKSVYPESPEILEKTGKTYITNLKCMLAKDLYDSKTGNIIKIPVKNLNELGISAPPNGWWVSEKLDGIRAIWDGEKFLSRNSQTGLGSKVFSYVPDFIKDAMPGGVALDGEIWKGRGLFNQVSSISNWIPGSKFTKKQIDDKWKGVNEPPIIYKVFDVPNIDLPYEERMKVLDIILLNAFNCCREKGINCPLEKVAITKIDSPEHLQSIYRTLTKDGAEGVMLRAPNSKYELRRSPYLLKFKIKDDAEGIVTERIMGTGRLMNMLGSLKVDVIKNGKPLGITTNVGTGFSDNERTNDPNNSYYIPVGSVISFSYMELTEDSVRHPSYRGIRTDVPIPPKDELKTTVKVKSIQFNKLGEYGDFGWMIKNPEYEDVLFIYNDDIESVEKYQAGKGNAIIRPYNINNPTIDKPRSAGIPTGSRKLKKGFDTLDEETKKYIDNSISIIKDIITKYNYTTIMYSGNKYGTIGSSIFVINEEVKDYITEQLRSLENIKVGIKESVEIKDYNDHIILLLKQLIQEVESLKEKDWQFKKKQYINALNAFIKNKEEIKNINDVIHTLRQNGMKLDKEEEYYKKNKEYKSAIVKKIHNMIETGNLPEESDEYLAITNLSKIPEIGEAKARKLFNEYGVISVEELRRLYETDSTVLTQKQATGLKYLEDLNTRIPRDEMNAWDQLLRQVYFEVLNDIKPENPDYTMVGSYRRLAESSGDIDILITSNDRGVEMMKSFKDKLLEKGIIEEKSNIFAAGDTKIMAVVKIDKKYRHLDIFYHPRPIYPFAILHSTGSKEFNVELRDLFLEKGFSLSEKGIKRGTSQGPDITTKDIEARIGKKTIDSEADIFDFIGTKYVKPEDRKSGIIF